MSTRSAIGILNDDGTVTSVYCHWDGYPSHNGAVLKMYYNTEDKVRELISLGSISYLDKLLWSEGHSFEKPNPDTTIAYHRDRGEELCIDTYANEAEYVEKTADDYSAAYMYLFKDGKWYYAAYFDFEIKELEV